MLEFLTRFAAPRTALDRVTDEAERREMISRRLSADSRLG
jgi:hypothetical protein